MWFVSFSASQCYNGCRCRIGLFLLISICLFPFIRTRFSTYNQHSQKAPHFNEWKKQTEIYQSFPEHFCLYNLVVCACVFLFAQILCFVLQCLFIKNEYFVSNFLFLFSSRIFLACATFQSVCIVCAVCTLNHNMKTDDVIPIAHKPEFLFTPLFFHFQLNWWVLCILYMFILKAVCTPFAHTLKQKKKY